MSVTLALEPARAQRAFTTLSLCFLTAVFEGIDLQSMGLAAPALGPEFHLAREQMGLVAAASPLGLFFGAFIGGRCADLWGRKNALLLSTLVFACFQLGTAWATSYSSLVALRFLCGLGLGGAMPSIIALTAEASGSRNDILNVVITVAGMPTGGLLASLIGFLAGAHADWRIFFYLGGVPPLVMLPIMAVALSESRVFREAQAATAETNLRPSIMRALFAEARATPTLLLWIALFFTASITYVMLNWLPVLMGSRGFPKTQALFIQVLFNVGAAGGSVLLGWRMQRRPTRLLLFACYVGLAAGLLAIALLGRDLVLVSLAVLGVGTFLLGANFILYGLAPTYYAVTARGTGSGAAVAAARLGSAAGPFFAGLLLGGGASEARVLEALLPVTAIAAAAAVGLLLIRPPSSRRSAES